MSSIREMLEPMTHATVIFPKPQVHAGHPFRNKKNHDKLLAYLQHRLYIGADARDRKLDRFVEIDKNVAGWMKLDSSDQKRAAKKKSTGAAQAVKMNLPVAYVQLDDLMTYFASTFSPNRGMFYHTGKPDETEAATPLVTLMNNNAIYAGYYRETLQTIFSLLKYNEGGFHVFWATDEGQKIVANSDGSTQLDSEIRWRGNRIEALDNYNFFADPQVHPTKLHCDGEFAAKVKMRSYFWLQRAASQGLYFNCEEALKDHKGLTEAHFYKSPPRSANMEQDNTGGTDWKSVLAGYDIAGLTGGLETAEIHIKLNPNDFGLLPGAPKERNRYEVWRFTILNNMYIIDATYLNNMHGYLPFFTSLLNDDLMESAQKSIAEIIQPLQDFASFLLNTHVAATRKNIWGATYYDPSMVDLSAIPDGEVAARVPVQPAAYGKDIRTFIHAPTNTLETKQTMQDLESVISIIAQFFPAQSLPSQIASIDRAVKNQVAAVQHGANRRQQKAARLLDETLFRNVRFALYYNLIQYQPNGSEVADFYTGKKIKIDLNALRNTDLPFIIGQGLKSIDRQASADAMREVIFALIQAPQASQGIDLLAMIDYWTSMMEIDADMKQFRLAPPTVEGQPGAPAAETPGIQPATNPEALTQPIYGS